MIAIAEAIHRTEKKSPAKLSIGSAHFKSAIGQVKQKEESSAC
jgi:hypothetical protein